MKYQIDDIDRKILSYLVKNARVPFLEIARECGISGAAIHQRVKKMEDAGTIEDVYEPFLIKSGFINRTPRGRVATEFAWHHLGLEAPRKIEE